MKNSVYLGLDVHSRHCVLGVMDSKGRHLGVARFKTSESELISHVGAVKATHKWLSLEEGSMAYWVSQVLNSYVDEILISDPRENSLISSNAHKRDELDTYELCRLHRLGELKRVYHPQDDNRAVFKAAVQHYLTLVADQTALKLQIKGKYRTWGVPEVDGKRVYGEKARKSYLRLIKAAPIAHQLTRLYELLDATCAAAKGALAEMCKLGRQYPEIEQFEKIPGIGPVGAHIFDAFVQTPERFATKAQLWRYCRLSITDRSSDGKPLGYQKIERSGVSALKTISYTAWKTAGCARKSNEVRSFYERSLEQTHDPTHARLNTQRKILSVMWALWKNKEVYQPEKFSSSTPSALVQAKGHGHCERRNRH